MRDLPHPATIKTSPPSLAGVIERPRLIDALAQLPTAAKWLQAPSGTGKSTLAASYARLRAGLLAWYRFDDRDNDPAFFYEHFAEAIGALLQLAQTLPKFSADDHGRQQEFAQRYFSALAAQIDQSILIVLDDMHRLIAGSMLSALTALVDVAGARIELLFVSEDVPPVEFFDVISGRRLALLNDVDLSFTAEECGAMTAGLRLQGHQSETIAAITGGHAGALVLACELLRGTDPHRALSVETVGRIHLHLLSKLVERMPSARRELLLQTAYVTQLTRPIAVALAGDEPAQQLDALVETGLLRHVGIDVAEVFEAHGLVRQGMQTLVRDRLGTANAQALAEQTATVLIKNDQDEAAFALLVNIGSTTRAIDVLRRLAERYAAQGHVDLLMSSIEKLPESEVQKDAWLCFWTGQALLRVDEEQARVWFTRAYFAFEASSDVYGMRLAAASNLAAFQLECGDLRQLDMWVEHHRRAGGDTEVAAGDRFETTFLMGIMCAAFVRARYPSEINPEALTARLRLLLDVSSAWLSDDQRVQGATLFIDHCKVFAKTEQGQNVIVATRSLIDNANGGVLHRGRWLIIAAYFHAAKVVTQIRLPRT